ncbi:uncharacterized protein C18orf19 homolog B-like [Paramormyrops kingsleyae]|uniref:Family with sequence similarity 210 member Ab n=1 Tax=Paramormyrops kingsleyae TaxID=1676925 RepID=A0A3B3TC67_9TELE|nr:uncharacterized protein C18orf19 homolog B-like [Paramormyrops kingsleyae]XP_023668967.1 uncharacterized protein C18orf19 homolog B-like [Paramormyrops kingsleyae]XP_023668977.1 uncharacterized protein C18orf19 homolog B-like [Paramormyrops kingsleyae]XP_023668987.1 uncharacterized protein C18orf19 homolog B-like [Paramormyrops kingsleyae]XP_023668996.1 uncharacterized protein C18orf19 homolog B-like [Paramormyrops kingsleyae]XP_023669007.1 uncharacterized protein C18orf19 homolog B-like [P
MQRLLSQKILWQTAAMRSVVICPAAREPSAVASALRRRAPCSCWLNTSVTVRAAGKRSPDPKEEPQPAPPTSLAGADPTYQSDSPQIPGSSAEVDPLQDRSIGLVQRFKKTFKQYGKVMIPVHLLTSCVWFGSFYYAAMKGVNVVQFLEYAGFPENIVSYLRDSQSGYAITAYALYKIATPARYTVTLAGTSISVKYLRKHGYLSTPPLVKDYLQDKMEETRERFSEKMEETKERLTEKMEETKELISERMEETKERLSEKMEETKDKFSEKLQETKDRISLRKKAD